MGCCLWMGRLVALSESSIGCFGGGWWDYSAGGHVWSVWRGRWLCLRVSRGDVFVVGYYGTLLAPFVTRAPRLLLCVDAAGQWQCPAGRGCSPRQAW